MKQLCLYISVLLCLLSTLPVAAQSEPEATDSVQVYLRVLPPRGLENQKNTTDILFEQLKQAVVLNGASYSSSPFVLETEIQTLSCQATPSAPPQFVVELDIICSISDRARRSTLQQTSFRVKGIAATREKAVMNAIMNIRARHPQLKKLIANGKEKIIASYQTEINE